MKIKSLLSSQDLINTQVSVSGWIRSIRKQRKISFIHLNDGSCGYGLQVICTKPLQAEYVRGTSITVTGTLVVSPASGQDVELKASDIQILGKSPEDYPIAKTTLSMEYLRKYPHLRARTSTFAAVTRLRDTMAKETHNFMAQKECLYIHTPIITSSDCEGAGEAFCVMDVDELESRCGGESTIPVENKSEHLGPKKFFRQDAFLTVSGQLQVEAFACSMGDVYTFGPTFRAEKSQTSRHLAEFWMIEPELVFVTLDEIMEFAEDYVKHCLRMGFDKCPFEMGFLSIAAKGLKERLQMLISEKFSRVTYTEAITILQEHGEDIQWGDDLNSDQEKYLVERYGNALFVTHYPRSLKSFYMKDSVDGKTVECFDLLVPGIGELIGGSMREDDYDKLIEKMTEKGLELDPYQWYLDLRKYGSIPHGGFGLGFERLIMLVTGISNIKDTIPFPVSYRTMRS